MNGIRRLYEYEPQVGPPQRHDVNEVEHIMVRISKQLEDLFKLSNTLVGRDLDALAAQPTTDLAFRTALRRPRTILAKILCENYFKGNMPLLTDIIYTKYPSAFIDRVPKVRQFGIDASDQARIDELWQTSAFTAVPVKAKKRHEPDFDTDGPTGRWPPPLPVISDDKLKLQVFTHRSASNQVASSAERRNANNERLEFRGDVLLGCVVVEIIYNRFPNYNEGELTKLKSRLVCNALLVEFSHAYELPARLICSPDVQEAITKKPESKFVADLFEAYVCGVEMTLGYEGLSVWLAKLYEPLIAAELAAIAPDTDKNAKSELYRLIGSSEQRIEYRAKRLDNGQHRVECNVMGEVLGVGTAQSKRDAGLLAAQHALKDKAAIHRLSDSREKIKEGIKAKRKGSDVVSGAVSDAASDAASEVASDAASNSSKSSGGSMGLSRASVQPGTASPPT